MKKLTNLITPFKRLSDNERRYSTIALIMFILAFWSMSGSTYLPTPIEIVKAIPRLVVSKDIFFHFQKSLFFCLSAIAYATVISLMIAYMSVLPLFSEVCNLFRKLRFLPSTGLSFLFMKLTVDHGGQPAQMMWMMVFGVTAWLLDSMIGIALSVTEEEINYGKSLRLSRWQIMRETLIYGKAAQMFQAVIANFAMAWTLLAAIENIAKASGGIGVILSESNKYYKFEEVYAIQILILLTGILIDFSLQGVLGFLLPYSKLNKAI